MNALLSPTLWLIVASIVVVAVFVLTTGHDRSEWGFKDVVKNPDYWDSTSRVLEDADAAAQAAKRWDDEQVASLTRRFVLEARSGREAWREARILRELGVRTHPTVLALLRDTSLYDRLVKPTGKDILPEAPFNRACDLLGDTPPPEAVEVLAPFLEHTSAEIRKDAALAIAKTGAPNISVAVRQALTDSDEYVRSFALMGLEFALNRSGLAANLREELFPDVLALLKEHKNADNAAEILFRLNPNAAKEFFLSPGVFAPDSPILHEILETLANVRVPAPRERLLELIAGLEAGELEYPRNYALGEALRLLGQEQREEDRDFLRARLGHAEERVARGAAEGLLCSYGLEGFQQRMWETEKQSGYGSLSEHQRFYSAVVMCDAEINNGGLAQYFVNSTGDQWHDAVAGFAAMGSKERLAILKEAIALFGKDGPSRERSIRQKQLSRLYRKNDSIFDGLDSRYYKSSEVVEVLASRFVLANPDSFR